MVGTVGIWNNWINQNRRLNNAAVIVSRLLNRFEHLVRGSDKQQCWEAGGGCTVIEPAEPHTLKTHSWIAGQLFNRTPFKKKLEALKIYVMTTGICQRNTAASAISSNWLIYKLQPFMQPFYLKMMVMSSAWQQEQWVLTYEVAYYRCGGGGMKIEFLKFLVI